MNRELCRLFPSAWKAFHSSQHNSHKIRLHRPTYHGRIPRFGTEGSSYDQVLGYESQLLGIVGLLSRKLWYSESVGSPGLSTTIPLLFHTLLRWTMGQSFDPEGAAGDRSPASHMKFWCASGFSLLCHPVQTTTRIRIGGIGTYYRVRGWYSSRIAPRYRWPPEAIATKCADCIRPQYHTTPIPVGYKTCVKWGRNRNGSMLFWRLLHQNRAYSDSNGYP
jgi:hypothetical protein